ncbi:translation initiation factor IF-2 [Tamlana nanhaiensis]|uniref:Translation initiation factor IF-2 n=1 Tax=Neotamlana nanhaiensis TaxID=1382798 RepID=A0A0D7W0L4_9FLAO|nr:SPOR domain-containing protein [Tamlana nanhaiensis]KJD32685.1 translation initiation factor IF-2 [Tamlana nanhaiensis]
MKVLNPKVILLTLSMLALSHNNLFAQEGTITINEDPKIKELLAIKKEINANETDSERYKIQVYSGHRNGAQTAQKEFSEVYTSWHPTLQYEAPNFKVWAGNFRTRLEADRALKSIKKTFPSAFIFKPKKS